MLAKIIKSGRPLNASDRSEAEIAGYRNVLKLLHDSGSDMPLSYNVILQLHRNLMAFTSGKGGEWKKVPMISQLKCQMAQDM